MYKIAILGCENSHADSFLKFIKENEKYADIEVVGLYSIERAAAEKLSAQFGVPVMEKYDELVGKIDGLIITARHGGWHYRFAKPYIKSGIPMFIDKPITISGSESEEFMAELKANNVRITGGSCLMHAKEIVALAKSAKESVGKICGGLVRAPIVMNSPHAGMYFYAQHGIEMVSTVFGRYPESVSARRTANGMDVMINYDTHSVDMLFTESCYRYYAVLAGTNDTIATNVTVDNYCFETEFAEFDHILRGGEQKVSYEDFIAPVYVLNAIERSLVSGKEEKVGKVEMKEFTKDKLAVKVAPSRREMGRAAALDIRAKILELLTEKDEINMIFAAAPSQNEVLESLISFDDIDWSRINAYHMDEYIGLPEGAPQAFGNFLREHIFDLVPFKSVNFIDATATDPDAEAARYGKLLNENPTDIVVMGIGENGHIAFNDPPVANFADPAVAKPVKLDEICRQQQVNDGCFATIDDVPTHAITLTVPTLARAPYLFCIVPAKTKAWAVNETLTGSIDEHCPATVLRTHDAAVLYLDPDSASQL